MGPRGTGMPGQTRRHSTCRPDGQIPVLHRTSGQEPGRPSYRVPCSYVMVTAVPSSRWVSTVAGSRPDSLGFPRLLSPSRPLGGMRLDSSVLVHGVRPDVVGVVAAQLFDLDGEVDLLLGVDDAVVGLGGVHLGRPADTFFRDSGATRRVELALQRVPEGALR
mgnify:CR=1 FL=1